MHLKVTVIRSSDDELPPGREMEFGPPGFVIGRSKHLSERPRQGGELGVRLSHDSVSRKHAEFFFDETSGIWIVRNFSQNGTLVDGVLLEPQEEAEITDDSRVTIGPFEFYAAAISWDRDSYFAPPPDARDSTSIHLPNIDDIDLDSEHDMPIDGQGPLVEPWSVQTLNPHPERYPKPESRGSGYLLDEPQSNPVSSQGGLMDVFSPSPNEPTPYHPSPIDVNPRGPGIDEAFRPDPVMPAGRSRATSVAFPGDVDFNPEVGFSDEPSFDDELGPADSWDDVPPINPTPRPGPSQAEQQIVEQKASLRPARNPPPDNSSFTDDDELPKPPRRTRAPRAAEPANEYEAAWRLFAKSAGADFDRIHGIADPKAQIALLGRAFRLMAEGLTDLLRTRALAKREHRVDMTVSNASDNNPLKLFGKEAVVQQLLGHPAPGFLTLEQSVEEGLADLIEHEAATIAGINAALHALVKKFDPDALEKSFANEAGSGFFGKVNFSVRAWARYRHFYDERARRVDDNFNALWGEEFRIAYENYVGQQEQRRHPGKRRAEFPSPRRRP